MTRYSIGNDLPFPRLKKQIVIADTHAPCPVKPHIVLPPEKTMANFESLLSKLTALNCDKETTLIAVGGGSLLDLVGFAASVYMRGIPHIFVPTTLLAMVDAAVGGKTGIDTPAAKNLIGTLYPAIEVLVDLNYLKTLPPLEIKHGQAEIFKLGLVYDAPLVDSLSPEKAIQDKIEIVDKDPLSKNIRRILNFGHTIGHALESTCRIPHGQAIALGCLAESHLSAELGYLPASELKTIQKKGLSFPCPSFSEEKVIQAMSHDKKGAFQFVLIDKMGHAMPFDGGYLRHVAIDELKPTLKWLKTCA